MVSWNQKNKKKTNLLFHLGKSTFLGPFLSLLLILPSCSPAFRYKTLSLFFDGVPSPETSTPQGTDTLVANDSLVIVTVATLPPEKPVFVHSPDCSDCHETGSVRELKMKTPGLCYQCHEDLHNTYPFLHGPVEGGYCTACHRPHVSDYPHLLIRQGQAICLHCHQQDDLTKNPAHDQLGDRLCTECHNPHGGANRFILKK